MTAKDLKDVDGYIEDVRGGIPSFYFENVVLPTITKKLLVRG